MMQESIESQMTDLSRICIGSWRLGGMHFGPYDQRLAHEMLDYCIDGGLLAFDTAQFYAKGQSNLVLRPHLKNASRSSMFVMAKGGLKWDDNAVLHDASAAHLKEDLYETLDTLDLDYLDYYFLHWPEPGRDLRESTSALVQFKKEGLIRHWGLCNVSPTEIDSLDLSDEIDGVQIKFNALDHNLGYLNSFDAMGVNVFAYSPLEQGILSDRFDPRRLTKKDWRHRNRHLTNSQSISRINGLRLDAKALGQPLEQYALNWVFNNSKLTRIIAGPRTVAQLKGMLNYLNS
jgi:aryl-alcohol dehydrogenase-like predicted oxidoreductase